jgi:hypothetical protein
MWERRSRERLVSRWDAEPEVGHEVFTSFQSRVSAGARARTSALARPELASPGKSGLMPRVCPHPRQPKVTGVRRRLRPVDLRRPLPARSLCSVARSAGAPFHSAGAATAPEAWPAATDSHAFCSEPARVQTATVAGAFGRCTDARQPTRRCVQSCQGLGLRQVGAP